MKGYKLVFAEMILFMGSVLAFRSMWMLLDKISFTHETRTLWLLLFLGGILTVIALSWIAKQGKK
jgi:hypothetical protein